MGGFASAGLLVGLGQGLNKGVDIFENRRQADLAQRRADLAEKMAQANMDRQQAQLELANRREDDINARAALSERNDFLLKGGRITRANGTEGIGNFIGKSTASTQPSEYDDGYETVGEYKGEKWQLPKDRLTPAERMKQQARQGRIGNAQAAFPNLKLTPGMIAALQDPETGDNAWQEYTRENFALDPANVANQARIAGATAQARWPFSSSNPENKSNPQGRMTPTQARNASRADRSQFIANARSNENQARTDVERNLEPRKEQFGWQTITGFPEARRGQASPDSLAWEDERQRRGAAHARASMKAAMAGYAADSATAAGQRDYKGIDEPSDQVIGMQRLKAAHDAYLEVFNGAHTPAEREEATRLYKQIEAETLAGMGRSPSKRGGGGGTF